MLAKWAVVVYISGMLILALPFLVYLIFGWRYFVRLYELTCYAIPLTIRCRSAYDIFIFATAVLFIFITPWLNNDPQPDWNVLSPKVCPRSGTADRQQDWFDMFYTDYRKAIVLLLYSVTTGNFVSTHSRQPMTKPLSFLRSHICQ